MLKRMTRKTQTNRYRNIDIIIALAYNTSRNRLKRLPQTIERCQSKRCSMCPSLARITSEILASHWLIALFAIGQPTRPTQPFILPGSINE